MNNLGAVPPPPYPDAVDRGDYVSVQQLAEQLGCAPEQALALVRQTDPRGVIRTGDRQFLIPAGAVEQLREAHMSEASQRP